MTEHLRTPQPPAGFPTTCKHDHDYTGANIGQNERGHRFCRTCARLREAHWRQKNKTQIAEAGRRYRASEGGHAKIVAYRRSWKAAKSAKGQLYRGYSKSILQTVGRERIEDAFAAIQRTGNMADVVQAIGTESRWRALRWFYPKIGDRMDDLRRQALIARRAEIIKPAKAAIIRVASTDLLDRINAVVPRALPRDQRQDIISDMVEAVLAGHVRLEGIAQHVNQFVRASFRADHNKFGPLSLDMPAFREGETPLIETISKGIWQ